MTEKVTAAVLVAPALRTPGVRPLLFPDGALLMQMEMSGICGTDKHTYQGETKQYAGTPAETETPFRSSEVTRTWASCPRSHPRPRPSLEFSGQRLAVGDRIVMCPDVVCGQCYECKHVMGYVWCENSECYGNSYTSAAWPHLMGGWSPAMYIRPDTFVYKVPPGHRRGSPC